ncbi:hypothetical protein NMY22_g19005 [Coprinellus aureogranulatus]|nr:hypothetical protein NMY22_g19005 [Coprinellus aureogranulatus]
MSRLSRARSDCWADVPLLRSGHLDLKSVMSSFSCSPDHFAIIDPARLKPVEYGAQQCLSPLAVHVLTAQGQLPLRVTALSINSSGTCMRTTSMNSRTRSHPFLSFYNILRPVYPATRRECEAPDLDILDSPTGESFIVDLPAIEEEDPEPEILYGKSTVARLFSGPTQSQLWCLSILGYAMFLWFVAAEVVACVRV